jgi:hypothetical protein
MTQKIIFGLAAALLISFTALLGWRWLHPQERACAASVKVCKPNDAARAITTCREALDDIHTRLGSSIERSTAECMLGADTCNESLACLAHADRRANESKRR